MNKRKLGKRSELISEIGFGAWAIGGRGYGEVSRADSEAAIHAYLDAGGRCIDTARGYGNSEQILGEVLSTSVEEGEVFLASKTGKTASMEQLPEIRPDVEQSLRNLKVGTIDLYYLHQPPEDHDLMNRVIDEFEKLKGEGKIAMIGASIKGPDVSQSTVNLCKQYVDTGRIDAIQLIYSILRQKNAESVRYAAEHGVGIIARTVLESGFLTGKFRVGHRFAADHHRVRWNAHVDTILEKIEMLRPYLALSNCETLSQIAMLFALHLDGVSTIIPGGRNAAQVEANMSISGKLPLPKDVVSEITNLFAEYNDKANTSKSQI